MDPSRRTTPPWLSSLGGVRPWSQSFAFGYGHRWSSRPRPLNEAPSGMMPPSHEQNRRLQRERASRAGPGALQTAEGSPQPLDHHDVQQRLPGRAARSQLPPGGRVHRPAAGAAGAAAPDGAAADAGCGARRVGGADHRGDPALRLRAIGQEGRAAHLDRRAARRGPARRRRRQPRPDDDAAFAAGARVLQRAGRSHERAQGAGQALSPPEA